MSEYYQQEMTMNEDMYRNNMKHNDMHEKLLNTIQDCEAICEEMTTMLKRKSDGYMRVMQLQLLRDCADICGLTAKYIARYSVFSKCTANLCGYICEVCGSECAKFNDVESQHCARVCMSCGKMCREFAMMS